MKFKKIIDVNGVPRSGTSWLAQLIDSNENVRFKFQPLFSNSFKDRISVNTSKRALIRYYNELYDFSDEYLDRTKQKAIGIYPKFGNKNFLPEILSSKHVTHHFLIPHLLETLEFYHEIFIIRNPCGVLNSFKNYTSDFDPKWNFSDEWEYAPKRGQFRPENYFGLN